VNEAAPVRAFIALELESRVRRAMGELEEQLAPRLAGVRLVRPEGIHLTLRFLGPSSAAQLAGLRPELAAASALCPAGEAALGGLGMFPERGSPGVLWLGIRLPDQVLELQSACERAARQVGFAPERRTFRPHLTLGRWRDRVPRPELPAVELGTTRLETLVLFASELRPEGAVHTPLERFALRRESGSP
jgi:2'-5' RNA ligase